jgi:hypothetical protein
VKISDEALPFGGKRLSKVMTLANPDRGAGRPAALVRSCTAGAVAPDADDAAHGQLSTARQLDAALSMIMTGCALMG